MKNWGCCGCLRIHTPSKYYYFCYVRIEVITKPKFRSELWQESTFLTVPEKDLQPEI